MITTDFKSDADTLTVIRVRWSDTIQSDLRQRQEQKMQAWLMERFKLDTLVIEGNRQ